MKMLILLLLATSVLLVGGCQATPPEQPGPDAPLSSEDTPVPAVPAGPPESDETHIIAELTLIDSLDVLLLESWPLQVNALIKGNLPDGCTYIQRVEVEREDDIFHLKVFTIREKEALCTQALVPFEEVVALDVYGLPAGTYTVDAYGVSAEFTFDRDNILENPSSGG